MSNPPTSWVSRSLLYAIAVGALSACAGEPRLVPLVPAPAQAVLGDGRFTIDADTRVVLSNPDDPELRRIASFVLEPLRTASGLSLPINGAPVAGADPAQRRNTISFQIANPSEDPAGPARAGPYEWSDRVSESYRIVIDQEHATIESETYVGLFRAVQALRQLLPAALEREMFRTATAVPVATLGAPAQAAVDSGDWSMPVITIDDEPRFPYRGMHLDVGRHMFPVEFIRKYIDMLAAYKMNVFHWHLTEDQGWRLEIEKYPRLTSVGGYRAETILERNFDPYIGDGVPYGGFYTQEEIRQVVEYAAQRYITVIPEIEMPGHSVAALAAYPELGCTPGPFEVFTMWGVTDDIYCPSERTFEFLQDVLTEVVDLFPSRYIHIGGDEAPKTVWEQSELAQEVIAREGLADENELQSYFIRRIETFLNQHGRRIIGWDEILEGGIAPEATVMSWRGTSGGIAAARDGHDVVMTPTSHLYFDYYQGDPDGEPLANGSVLPLDRVYSFEPVPPELSAQEARFVLGAQGNVWTEYMKTSDHVEYMVMPRMLALSEVVWSPAAARSWSAFVRRLPVQLARLDAAGINYRVPEVLGLESDVLTLDDEARVELRALAQGTIRYTLDGTMPSRTSSAYSGPFTVPVDTAGVMIHARLFLPDGRAGATASARFARATMRPAESVEGMDDGLQVAYIEGRFRSAESARQREPSQVSVTDHVAIPEHVTAERFALRFDGFIRIPRSGIWTFVLNSDDGSRLYIGDQLVVNHDGPHGPSDRAGQMALRRGWHPVQILYYQGGGGRALSLSIARQGDEPEPVRVEQLGHTER